MPDRMTNNQDDWMSRALKLEAEIDRLKSDLGSKIHEIAIAIEYLKRRLEK